jgi:hypothetical protein
MLGGVRSHMRTGLHLQFPANREINREFCDFDAFASDTSTKAPVPQPLLGKFPTQINRDNIFEEQGIFSSQQGIS